MNEIQHVTDQQNELILISDVNGQGRNLKANYIFNGYMKVITPIWIMMHSV